MGLYSLKRVTVDFKCVNILRANFVNVQNDISIGITWPKADKCSLKVIKAFILTSTFLHRRAAFCVLPKKEDNTGSEPDEVEFDDKMCLRELFQTTLER